VVLEQRTFIYDFDDLRLIDAIETCPNAKGLVALSPDPENAVLATPDKTLGNVRVNIYEKNRSVQIVAHQNPLSALCLNFAGTLLATASDRGTLVRIFSTDTGNALQELRRGREKAEIHSICFDLKGSWLACSSDRSTIHIFTVNIKADSAKIKLSDEEAKTENEDRPENKKSGLKFLKGFSTYFDSEWSFARFKIPNDDNSDNHTCAFS
jgi:WD repeat-containing protein 45